MNANIDEQPVLIRSLLKADSYAHPVEEVGLIETHISWVILTGPFAYKIKKPVDFGFLDFSTLEKRLACCNEELRLNSRLAADIYLEVVPVAGSAENPVLHGDGEVIEYAVKMVQFPQHAQLDNMLASGELGPQHIDAIAGMVAGFHQAVDVATEESGFGDPQHVYQPVAENFTQIRQHVQDTKFDEPLATLERWSSAAFELLKPDFQQRRQSGFIRECHGDMHLRNLVWFNGKPLAFDCLEFNPSLRWIDTMSEVAFLVMDLQDRNQPQLAWRCLNRYLERCGDYQGTRVLRFYLMYRALVRAKVDAIRAGQPGISEDEHREAEKEFDAYLKLAQGYTRQSRPKLILTRGLSASGKSTLTQPLLECIGAIRIRSDVERKRLFRIKPGADSGAGIDQGIYTAAAGIKTYDRLRQLSAQVLEAGYTVIVDAAFLKQDQRQPFIELADAKQLPVIILEFTASANTLRQRIRARVADISDADLEVLEHQLATVEPLLDSELPFCIGIDTEKAFDVDQLVADIERLASSCSR